MRNAARRDLPDGDRVRAELRLPFEEDDALAGVASSVRTSAPKCASMRSV